VANLEAALERAEAEAADARREHRAAVTAERAAVLRYLQHLPEVCVACCDAAVSDAIDAIEDGLHRPGGDS
jgi:hypothetical protein